MAVVMTGVLVLFLRLLDDGRLGGDGCKPWVPSIVIRVRRVLIPLASLERLVKTRQELRRWLAVAAYRRHATACS